MEISYQYAVQCRYNTLNGVTPSNISKYTTEEYKAVIEIGKRYIAQLGVVNFSSNLRGDQYFIALWTAHIILLYGNPELGLKEECIKVIKEYSDNPLSPEVSLEEKEWMKENEHLL